MQSNEVASEQIDNLVNMIDGYAEKGGHHLTLTYLLRTLFLMLRHTQRSILS